MFGYGKRIKALEDEMQTLRDEKIQAERCKSGRHEWTYEKASKSSYDNSEGRRCKYCQKFVKLEEVSK